MCGYFRHPTLMPEGKPFHLQGCSAAEDIQHRLKNHAQRQHRIKKTKDAQLSICQPDPNFGKAQPKKSVDWSTFRKGSLPERFKSQGLSASRANLDM
jgi:hypothetical protein